MALYLLRHLCGKLFFVGLLKNLPCQRLVSFLKTASLLSFAKGKQTIGAIVQIYVHDHFVRIMF